MKSLVALLLLAAAAPAAATQGLDALGWMTGCWQATTARGIVIEEVYTSPAQNLMQGMTRYLRDGRVIDWEFTTITPDSAGPTLRPQPRGGEPTAFPFKELGDRRAVWENLQHDFPQRITYARVHADTLVARIEGPAADGSTRALEWRMHRSACPAPTPER